MKKLIAVIFFVGFFQIAGFSQQTVAEKQIVINEEIKNELVQHYQFSAELANKVLEIENKFYKDKAELELMKASKQVKDQKLHQLHVTRRTQFTDNNIRGRQLEDAIMVVEKIRLKHQQ